MKHSRRVSASAVLIRLGSRGGGTLEAGMKARSPSLEIDDAAGLLRTGPHHHLRTTIAARFRRAVSPWHAIPSLVAASADWIRATKSAELDGHTLLLGNPTCSTETGHCGQHRRRPRGRPRCRRTVGTLATRRNWDPLIGAEPQPRPRGLRRHREMEGNQAIPPVCGATMIGVPRGTVRSEPDRTLNGSRLPGSSVTGAWR